MATDNEKDVLRIDGVETEIREDQFVLRFKVHNSEERTMYAYGSARRIDFDHGSGTLRLFLHDQHVVDPIIAQHLKAPHFEVLEGGRDGEIELTFPRVLHRMLPASETGGVPRTEGINLDQTNRVEIEIGHQDTPFYFNPNGPSPRDQLVRWAGRIARGTFDVKPNGVKGKGGSGRRRSG